MEELVDTMSLDEFLIENKEATFLLRVTGESMKDAGILPGDLLLVERGRQARVGDIVVALEDGEYVLRFYKKSEVKFVEAVVKGVMRKY